MLTLSPFGNMGLPMHAVCTVIYSEHYILVPRCQKTLQYPACDLVFKPSICLSVSSPACSITNLPLNTPLLCMPYPTHWPNRPTEEPHLPLRLGPVGNHIMPSSPFH